jgi:hypothetical protein
MDRHREKAGMTGWAQVNGLRGDTSIAERTKYDLWYIENWSIWLDFKIISFRSPRDLPTEAGYRYFVERLMRESHLPLEEQRTIRHQFHQVGVDLEQWMRLAASVLARTAQSAAVVTSMKTEQSHLKHLELVSIHETMALLIVVLEGGLVRQQYAESRRSCQPGCTDTEHQPLERPVCWSICPAGEPLSLATGRQF